MTSVLFNSRCKPFDDLRVRQAFAHAIDKQWIVDTYFPSFSPATGGLIPPGIPGHSPGIGLPYDPVRAQKLLSEAGYPGGKNFPDKKVWVELYPNQRLLFEALCKQWLDVLGVEIRYEFSKAELILRDVLNEGECIEVFGVVPDYLEGDWYLRCVVENYLRQPMGWRGEAYDQLMQASRFKTDQEERLGIYSQADRILTESAVVVPVFNEPHSFFG